MFSGVIHPGSVKETIYFNQNDWYLLTSFPLQIRVYLFRDLLLQDDNELIPRTADAFRTGNLKHWQPDQLVNFLTEAKTNPRKT